MKKSLSDLDATKGGGFGAQEGLWKIVKARTVIHQFPANTRTGEQYPASTMIRLELLKVHPDTFEPVDDEPVDEYLTLGRKNDLTLLRPGHLNQPEDHESEDMGAELGTEGNTIFVDSADVTFYDSCSWMKFSKSLRLHGFKPEILATAYLPYLEGTVFEAERLKGFRNPAASPEDREPTSLGVKKILKFGYEKPAPKAMAARAGAKVTPMRTGPATTTVTNPPPNGQAAMEDQVARAAVENVRNQMRGKPPMKRPVFQAAVMTYLMKKSSVKTMKEKNDLLNATVKDDGWLAQVSAEMGFVVDFEAGMLEFPAE